MNEIKGRSNIFTVPRKVLFLEVQSLNDATEETVTQRLGNTVQKTFTVPKLDALF